MGKGGLRKGGLDPGPARQASSESWECIQRAKTQTALAAPDQALLCRQRLPPLHQQQTIPGQIPLLPVLLCRLLFPAPDSGIETKCHAIPVPLLSFSFCFGDVLALFFLSLPVSVLRPLTQLKWFAAAKKISLFSSHSRSLAAPPLASSLSLT